MANPSTAVKVTKASIKAESIEIVRIFGLRMKEAREISGLTQVDAAKLLGYEGGSSGLAKVEAGLGYSASIPWWLVPKASKVYDVSCDYLYGFTSDWERDPVVSQQLSIERKASGWLFGHWERARAAEVNAIRVLSNRLVTVEKAVFHSIKRSADLNELVKRFRELNPCFDDLKLGAKLLRICIETAEDAAGISAELKRYHASVEIADKGANIKLRARDFDRLANGDIFEDMEDL